MFKEDKKRQLQQRSQSEKRPAREPIPQPSDRKMPEREPIPVPPDAERPVPIKEPPMPAEQPPIDEGQKVQRRLLCNHFL
ncbi:MAG: hypothetical protein AB1489_42870 [Acidobacteriota bacterium]